MAGADDHRRRSGGLEPLQNGHTVDAGQPEVEENEIVLFTRKLGDGGLAGIAERGLMPFIPKDVRECLADGSFVVDDEDFCHLPGSAGVPPAVLSLSVFHTRKHPFIGYPTQSRRNGIVLDVRDR